MVEAHGRRAAAAAAVVEVEPASSVVRPEIERLRWVAMAEKLEEQASGSERLDAGGSEF